MIVPLSFSKSDYVGLGLVVWFIQILDRDKIKTDGRIIIYTRTPESLSLPILRWCGMALISIKHIVFTVLIFFQNCWKSEIIKTQVEQTKSPNIGIVPI